MSLLYWAVKDSNSVLLKYSQHNLKNIYCNISEMFNILAIWFEL